MAEPMPATTTSPWVPPDTFGSRLVSLRRHLHLSQEEAAERAGLNPKTWNTWESGRTPRQMNEVVEAISKAYGVDRNWLMWGNMAFGYKPDFAIIAGQPGEQMELSYEESPFRPLAVAV